MPFGRISGKGQTTVPEEIRARFDLRPGDKVIFSLENRCVLLRPFTGRNSDLRHILPRPYRSLTIEEMDEGIARAVTEDNARIRAYGAQPEPNPTGLAEDLEKPEPPAQAEYTATITSKGQVTVPRTIRDHLDLHPGNRVVYTISRGRVVLRAKNKPITSVKGLLYRPGQRPVSLEEMDEAIAEGAAGLDRDRYKSARALRRPR
jgi:AbrB family looped-hinge helix DNA binding protein